MLEVFLFEMHRKMLVVCVFQGTVEVRQIESKVDFLSLLTLMKQLNMVCSSTAGLAWAPFVALEFLLLLNFLKIWNFVDGSVCIYYKCRQGFIICEGAQEMLPKNTDWLAVLYTHNRCFSFYAGHRTRAKNGLIHIQQQQI